ncbi:NAD(P)-dependent dehydrogenase, short-chain alcohol dehydrogenase family [Terribacillus aidingensis]|uniref:NAD(P)-dependent dehydrogenase, short-chain alcohol dehydrogenase family n=1 Tax=Terribacillus aidingensis TaxID=586416 RepID=A0A285N0L5_9BACI|nr:glucose 1-dehydrogenase [Terribacillus aidingensis]SNZ02878.1 NAD(P)-dependent dehydrogenase, short-chain alcohol dehydrogenase family [Terribacillus aidingensis]
MTAIDGKVAIVTGAASGIGLATAEAYAKKGAKVVIADFNAEAGQKETDKLKQTGADVLFIEFNAADEDSIKNLIDQTISHYGQVDILVNNAGIGNEMGPTDELSYEDYRKVIAVNQDGMFLASKYAIKNMLKSGSGVIINTSSILGFVAQPGAFAYNASKGAVNTLTKSLAVEYADKGIRVNAINPGFVESGMMNKEALGDFYDSLVAKHPIGRLGKADEIAHAIVFLTENDFVTGETLVIDGGYLAQ